MLALPLGSCSVPKVREHEKDIAICYQVCQPLGLKSYIVKDKDLECQCQNAPAIIRIPGFHGVSE